MRELGHSDYSKQLPSGYSCSIGGQGGSQNQREGMQTLQLGQLGLPPKQRRTPGPLSAHLSTADPLASVLHLLGCTRDQATV